MKKNMGKVDRIIRTVVALALGALLITGRVHGILAIVLGVVAGAFLVTSLIGVCPGYLPMKFSTRKPLAPAKK